MKILFVEDYPAANWERKLKHSCDCLLIHNQDPQLAIRTAHRERPALILMDVKFDNDVDYPAKWRISGSDAAEQIHSRYDIPSVFITVDPSKVKTNPLAMQYGLVSKLDAATDVAIINNAILQALAVHHARSDQLAYFSLGQNESLKLLRKNIKNAEAFAAKIYSRLDPLAKTLWGHLSATARLEVEKAMDNYPRSVIKLDLLKRCLLRMSNNAIAGDSLYSKDAFTDVNLRFETGLRAETGKLSEEPHNETALLNRLLLEDAYPLELSRTVDFTALSLKAQSIFGYTLSQIRKKSIWDEITLRSFEEAMREGNAGSLSGVNIIAKSGARVTLNVSFEPIMFFNECLGLKCSMETS